MARHESACTFKRLKNASTMTRSFDRNKAHSSHNQAVDRPRPVDTRRASRHDGRESYEGMGSVCGEWGGGRCGTHMINTLLGGFYQSPLVAWACPYSLLACRRGRHSCFAGRAHNSSSGGIVCCRALIQPFDSRQDQGTSEPVMSSQHQDRSEKCCNKVIPETAKAALAH